MRFNLINDNNNNQKENYQIEATLLEEKTLIDTIFLKYNVQVTFNYTSLPGIQSGKSDIVEVLIDSNNFQIVDIYEQNDWYDQFVRGEQINIIKESSSIKVTKNDLLKEKATIKEKQKSLIKNINKVYKEERIGSAKNTLSGSEIGISSTWFNKNAIVNYARNNYNKTSPVSGNGVVPYYDFSQISGNWDCTNFVSHALLAGGATVYDTGGTGISATGWYYRNLSNRSSSWSGVQPFHTFITTNQTKGPSGVSSAYSIKRGSFTTGDVLQFHNGSIWRHSTIITGYIDNWEFWEALVTGRSAPNQFNNNQKASDIYPGHSKRTISLIRNY